MVGFGEHEHDVGIAEHVGVLRLGQVLIASVDIGASIGLQVGVLLLPVTGVVQRVVLSLVNDGVAAHAGIGEVLSELCFGDDGHITAIRVVVQKVVPQILCDGHKAPARLVIGVVCAQATDATQLDHAVAVDTFEPAPIAGPKWVVLDLKHRLCGVHDVKLIELLHVVFQLVNTQVNHVLESFSGQGKQGGIVSFQVGPIEVGLAHERVSGTLGDTSFLSAWWDHRESG